MAWEGVSRGLSPDLSWGFHSRAWGLHSAGSEVACFNMLYLKLQLVFRKGTKILHLKTAAKPSLNLSPILIF